MSRENMRYIDLGDDDERNNNNSINNPLNPEEYNVNVNVNVNNNDNDNCYKKTKKTIENCINYVSDKWNEQSICRQRVIIGVGVTTVILGLYASASAIVRAKSETQRSDHSRAKPFQNVIPKEIEYNPNSDRWLNFITASVSLQLRDETCTHEEGISWTRLTQILQQAPELKNASGQSKSVIQTYNLANSDHAKVMEWLHNVITGCDEELTEFMRFNDTDITEVIQFVMNQSVGFTFFSNSVSKSTSVLDIGLIRFPTKELPYLKLYRIQLSGTFSGSGFTMFFSGAEERILTVNVKSCEYHPNNIILQRINPEYVDKTIARFEDMLLRD